MVYGISLLIDANSQGRDSVGSRGASSEKINKKQLKKWIVHNTVGTFIVLQVLFTPIDSVHK